MEGFFTENDECKYPDECNLPDNCQCQEFRDIHIKRTPSLTNEEIETGKRFFALGLCLICENHIRYEGFFGLVLYQTKKVCKCKYPLILWK